MNRALIIQALDFNLHYAKELLKDIPDQIIADCPGKGLENHPAFTLGHLCMASARMTLALGGEMNIPAGYSQTFDRKGPGDPRLPSTRRNDYPSKEELLSQLQKQHDLFKITLKNVSDEQLKKAVRWRFGNYFETKYEMLLFMSCNHESMHLAQIAAWRRALGFESAFARI